MEKINIKIKKFAPVGLAVAVLLILFIGIGSRKAEEESKLTLVLDYGNDDQQVLQVATSEQKRAWSLLQQAAAVSGIDLVADNNFVPIKIDGFANAGGKQWNFYVNEVMQNTSPYEVIVGAPNKITFRFE